MQGKYSLFILFPFYSTPCYPFLCFLLLSTLNSLYSNHCHCSQIVLFVSERLITSYPLHVVVVHLLLASSRRMGRVINKACCLVPDLLAIYFGLVVVVFVVVIVPVVVVVVCTFLLSLSALLISPGVCLFEKWVKLRLFRFHYLVTLFWLWQVSLLLLVPLLAISVVETFAVVWFSINVSLRCYLYVLTKGNYV